MNRKTVSVRNREQKLRRMRMECVVILLIMNVCFIFGNASHNWWDLFFGWVCGMTFFKLLLTFNEDWWYQ